jgi:poly(hydroxyalkanoate) depolymerase family esterase
MINNPNRCFNWFTKKDANGNDGEKASVMTMLKYGFEHWKIDSNQLFVYGVSAGAAMSMNLIANHPETFSGAAIFAGGPYGIARNATQGLKVMMNPPEISAEELASYVRKNNLKKAVNYPKVIVAYGASDQVVHPRNSGMIIEQWTTLHETDDNPERCDSTYANNNDILRCGYDNKNGIEVVVFYIMKKLGHALSVDPGTEKYQGGKTGIFSKDKDFFSTYWIAKDFGLIAK